MLAKGVVAPGLDGVSAWFPEQAALVEGFVRGSFRVDAELEATLVIRGTVDTETGHVSGLGVRISGKHLALVRMVNGVSEALGSRESITRFKRRREIGITSLVLGSTWTVQVYDVRSKKHIVSLGRQISPSDTPGKRLGVLFAAQEKHTGALTGLSSRSACTQTPPRKRRGARRYVTLASSELSRIPKPMMESLDLLERIAERQVFRTDALGLEALHCAGVTLQSVTVETPWKYTDRSYRRARDKEPVPTARGFDILATYKSPDMIERLLRAYHKRYPATTELVDMGRSHEGRKLLALKISRDVATSQGKAAVLLNGAHHGNELMSSEFVLDAIDYVLTRQDRSRQVKRWLDELVIWAVPMVNPDGRWHFLETTRRTGRKNGEDSDGSGQRDRLDGVDLNRNYPYRWHSLGERGSRSRKSAVYYRGHRAGSEPETQALMRLNNSEHFVASVSYHTGTVAVLAPYTIEGAKDPRPNEAWLFAEWLTGQLETHPEEREWELKRNLYAVDGTDQDWHRHAHGTLALLIEGARKSPRTPAGRRAVLENVRPTWTLLFDRVVRGTGVYGVVTDSEGRPVQAEVRLKEQKLRDGERWTSRCRDGRFDRVLARAGKWTLEVRVAGHPPVFKKFRARARRRQRVDVSLPFPVTPSSCPVAADPTVPFTEPREVPDSGSAAPPPP